MLADAEQCYAAKQRAATAVNAAAALDQCVRKRGSPAYFAAAATQRVLNNVELSPRTALSYTVHAVDCITALTQFDANTLDPVFPALTSTPANIATRTNADAADAATRQFYVWRRVATAPRRCAWLPRARTPRRATSQPR
jgi:hypothetical protein